MNAWVLQELDLSDIYSVTPEEQRIAATISPSTLIKEGVGEGEGGGSFISSSNPANLGKIHCVHTSEELNPALTVTQLSLGVRAQGLEGLCQR